MTPAGDPGVPPDAFPDANGARLPIFPLGVVLFPGTPLPLHLFEPRYRQLLTDVEAGPRRFGIVTAIPGVGERDLPAGRVGCVAQLTDVDRLPDGRANIIVAGGPRFALQRFVADPAPYHVADVTWLADLPVASHVALAVLAEEVAANFRRVIRAVQEVNGITEALPTLPDDPALLPWSIGAMIDLDVDARYQLLADRDPASRLSRLDALLRKVLPDLELRGAMARGSRGESRGESRGR
jgi:Lon protease-like protein